MTFTLTNSWIKYEIPFVFPQPSTTLGVGEDDAWYMQIGFPAGAIFDTSIAIPRLYLGNIVPTDDFQTYDQVDRIISLLGLANCDLVLIMQILPFHLQIMLLLDG